MRQGTDASGDVIDRDTVLRDEAKAIHGVDLQGLGGDALYRKLNGLGNSALCLSGGGIRSATFALGVIEALAMHPRRTETGATEKQTACAAESLLSQFNYLSTVSGGGYIGSWLSAWIARSGYATVWQNLIGRREHPDVEPGETAWLRSYSNYLTPRLGLFSADTWTAAALYIRNLVLNWLVVLPAVILVLLLIKTFGVGVFWLSYVESYALAYAAISVVLMLVALRFALLNRPSRDPCTIVETLAPTVVRAGGSEKKDPHHNEAARMRSGGNEARFKLQCLLPAIVAALFLSLYLLTLGAKLEKLGVAGTILLSLACGAALYALAWIIAWPPATWVPCKGEVRGTTYWSRDFGSWIAAGAVYGALVGAGLLLFAIIVAKEWWFVIGNPDVKRPTAVFLLALIYGTPWVIVAQLIAEMIFVGLTSWQPHSDADREWFGRSTGWFTTVACSWFAGSFVVFVAGVLIWYLVNKYVAVKYGGSIVAAASAAFTTFVGKSSKTSAGGGQKTLTDKLTEFALPLAATVFLLALVLVLSALTDFVLFGDNIIYTSLLDEGYATQAYPAFLSLGIGFAVTAFVACVAWMRVNINRFSAHSIYRNRLIRAYLGASNAHRAPNPFTGFDETDNLTMANLWPPSGKEWRPFHVVNAALNVVNSNRLAWQERKAEPFTMTPLHCGTAANNLGYRPTAVYGGEITLGTALSISGAAASPNMGYHSSPLVTLLLALFNVRLGWWLGNPGPAGSPRYYQSEGPKVAIKPFIAEMFGLTTDDRHYVYLSDGGHYENLGLYEMVRRRCRWIVVSDAGCDPDFAFADLGNAVRKIAIDLGVYITLGKLHELKKRSKEGGLIEGAYYALGKIDYKNAPEWNTGADACGAVPQDGYILYIKPGYHGTESAGVVAYATANAAFPHETTADQFFSESQFESYRMLGFEIMDGVLREAAENVDIIADSGILKSSSPSRGQLRDCIMALEAKLVADAALARRPHKTKLANVVGALDDDVIAELGAALKRAPVA